MMTSFFLHKAIYHIYRVGDPGSGFRGVCISSDGTWQYEAHLNRLQFICEWNGKFVLRK